MAALGLAVGVAMLGYLATVPAWTVKVNNFYSEAWPAYHALAQGHLLQFLRNGPAYVGSLVLRAPFALIASGLGGGAGAAYFWSALPCVAAEAAFCAWLSAQPRSQGGIGWASRLSPLLLWFFNPLVLIALLYGHPEDLLGAVLCVAGVVLAARGEEKWSGVLIGLAVANKSWALVSVPVALAAMPAGRRGWGLTLMAAVAAAVLVPVTLVRDPGLSVGGASAQLGSETGAIFYNTQLLWWFGPHAWIVRHAHPAIVLLSMLCGGLWWALRVRRATAGERTTDALAVLTLVLLLRAALDPWNNLYYHVPFLLSLMTLEICTGHIPRLTLLYTIVLAAIVQVAFFPVSPDIRSAAYAAVVIPTSAWLAARAFAPRRRLGAAGSGRARDVMAIAANADTDA
jgi:hypothetical protein